MNNSNDNMAAVVVAPQPAGGGPPPPPRRDTATTEYGTVEVTELVSSNGKYKFEMEQDFGNLAISGEESVTFKCYGIPTPKLCGPPFKLHLQKDGNLVASNKNNGILWDLGSNDKSGGPGPYKLVMQNDRNLVIYNGDGKDIWNSSTSLEDRI